MSNAGARIHKAAKSQYAAIPNAIAQSRALSPAARAVLVELLSRPDDWEAKPSQLAYKPHLSVRTVYRILGELIEAGYVVRKRLRARMASSSTGAMTYSTRRLTMKPVPNSTKWFLARLMLYPSVRAR